MAGERDLALRPPVALDRRRFLGLAAGVALGAAGVGSWRLVDWLGASSGDVHGFVSRPDLRPPTFDALERGAGRASGHLFVAPSSGPGQYGALIMGDGGSPIWFTPAGEGRSVMNLRVQRYRGEPMLTWWEGTIANGFGDGEYVIADHAYRTIARLHAGNGYAGDLHEFVITPDGTALVTVVRTVPADLTSVGGPADGAVIDSGLQELDIASGRVLMHWSGLGRIALDESYRQPITSPYDYLHLNSIDVGADGNLLVSGRHTWTLYRIDRDSGAILTRIGGKRSDLVVGRDAAFAWQHDALWRDQQTITLFDDSAQAQSRALVLALDGSRVRLARAYAHQPGLLATAEGSMQTLPNGDVLVGWGTQPWVTEFSAGGDRRFDGRFRGGGTTYRAFRESWVGRPTDRPAVAVQQLDKGLHAWVSWNGSTETAAWLARGSATADAAGRELVRVPRTGFETRIPLGAPPRYLRITALDANGAVLGASDLVDTA
jgi:hypothetical protein